RILRHALSEDAIDAQVLHAALQDQRMSGAQAAPHPGGGSGSPAPSAACRGGKRRAVSGAAAADHRAASAAVWLGGWRSGAGLILNAGGSEGRERRIFGNTAASVARIAH